MPRGISSGLSLSDILRCMTQIKIYSWNVNGIRAVIKKDALLPFLHAEKPDILCLQEMKGNRDQVDLEIPGYTQYWNSADRPGHFGTAIFTKIAPIAVSNGFADDISEKYKLDDSYGDASTEGRVVTAEYEKFYVVTVYTPNAKDDLTRIPLRHRNWDPAFLAHCKELEKKKPVVFCGDLNVAHTEDDLARPKQNRSKKGFTDEEREGFDNFLKAGFVDTLRLFKEGNGFYTWWSNFGGARGRNVGWRIDYFLVSESLKDKVVAADIHPEVMGSDHCPVSIILDV